MKNKVLILLASYNGAKYISEQILSLKNQIECEVHILISDDGSTDDTLSIIRKLRKKYNLNIKILRNTTKTGSFNGNFLNLFINANCKNYEYIALSDQDDVFMRDKFFKSITLLKKNNAYGMSTSVEMFGHSNKILTQSNKITKYDFLFEGAGQGCTFFMTAKKFCLFQEFCKKHKETVKKFYYHDWLIYIFYRAYHFKWHFHNDPLTKYRIHVENNTGSKLSFSGIFSRVIKILNGWYLKQIFLAIKIFNLTQPKSKKVKINFLNIFFNMIFHGRRKMLDRSLSLLSLISYLWVKK